MLMTDLAGQAVDTYRLYKEIGRGSYGRVYKAYDTIYDRDVAIKVIATGDHDDVSSMAARADREVQATKLLFHPHIARVYDTGRMDDFVYIVMHNYGGQTLKQRMLLTDKPITVKSALNKCIQMARALNHAHKHGIIHRDIKPANMLLDMDTPGRYVLSDFGIAKIMQKPGITQAGLVVGTAEYASPEQLSASPDMDGRADIYSLGCVLWHVLTKRLPFPADNPMAVAYRQVNDTPLPPSHFNGDVTPEVDHVVLTMMAKQPENRYRTAEIAAVAMYQAARGLDA